MSLSVVGEGLRRGGGFAGRYLKLMLCFWFEVIHFNKLNVFKKIEGETESHREAERD